MNKEVNEERAPQTVTDVKEMLTKHSNGEIQRTIQNCITILQNDHVLADAIRLNLLSERIDIVKPVGWPRSGKTLNDTDMKYILRRMEKYGISSEKKIESAIRIVANENRYHPIRDYLNGLKWDGTERIAHVLHHFLGAAEDEYTCEAMKIFLLGAIKRVFQPGCKFETMLCLVGGQGCGSPVATSKCCKHFEAPTEPTGETGEVQLFPAAGSQGRVVLRRPAAAGRRQRVSQVARSLDHRNVRDDRHCQRQKHRGDQELSQQTERNL